MKGFTFMEVVIVMGIFAILFAVGLPIGLDAYRNYILNSEANSMASFLRRAQNYSFSNMNGSSHGFYLGPDKFIVFEGNSFGERDQSKDEEFYRAGSVDITGPSEVIFSPISGNAGATASFVLGNSLGEKTIEVNEQGIIFW